MPDSTDDEAVPDSTDDMSEDAVLSTEDVVLETSAAELAAADEAVLDAADEVVLDAVDVVGDEAVPPQAARPRAIIEERTTAKIFFFMFSSLMQMQAE